MVYWYVKGFFGVYLEIEFIEVEEYFVFEFRSCFYFFLEFLVFDMKKNKIEERVRR